MTDRLLRVISGEERLSKEDKVFLFGYTERAKENIKDNFENVDTDMARNLISEADMSTDKDFERVLNMIDKFNGE